MGLSRRILILRGRGGLRKRPQDIASSKALQSARVLIAQKVEHTPMSPNFSRDGRFALLTTSCPDQIHPVIATQWYILFGAFTGGSLDPKVREEFCRIGLKILERPVADAKRGRQRVMNRKIHWTSSSLRLQRKSKTYDIHRQYYRINRTI